MNLFSRKKNDELRISMPIHGRRHKCNSVRNIQKELITDFNASLVINNHNKKPELAVSWFIVKPENYVEKYDVNELTEYLKIFPWV